MRDTLPEQHLTRRRAGALTGRAGRAHGPTMACLLRMMSLVAALLLVVGCGDDDGDPMLDAGAGDAGSAMDAAEPPGDAGAVGSDSAADATLAPDTGPHADGGPGDLDGDGLDDAEEERLAYAYLPFLSVDPTDDCALSGVVYRARPHPSDPTRVHFIVDLLFENDCGAGGHVGDDEVFGMTIDPSRPAPEGILAVRAISHQGTACEHISECGSCAGLSGCTTALRDGLAYPVVFYSKNKHGAYMSEPDCDGACFLTNYCALAPASAMPILVNAGEPTAPLTNDLTAAGLVTAANGWTEPSLFDFDPWGASDFGTAGSVRGDLIDDAFLTPACP